MFSHFFKVKMIGPDSKANKRTASPASPASSVNDVLSK